MQNLELRVWKARFAANGDIEEVNPVPQISPCQDNNEAINSALHFSSSNKSTVRAEIATRKVRVLPSGLEDVVITPFITFTRTGRQEFAKGDQPWWDTMK